MRRKILPSLLGILLCLSFLAPSAMASGTVTADALNLRSEPGTDSEVQALLYKGSYLVVTGRKGDWYDVIYDGTRGFVHADYVDYTYTEDGKFGTTGTVRGMSVRMRSEPSLSARVLGWYNTGATFSVLAVDGDWVRVRTDAGLVGYIHSDYISCSAAGNVLTSSYDARCAEMMETAKLYLGVPYVWGGMSPYGFDCSGFVSYVYAAYGYPLWRVAQDMYNYDGVHVERSELRAGDIICFGYGPRSITHVGLYLGGGMFIHASSGSGEVVISELSQNYYSRMYVGAKRIIGN